MGDESKNTGESGQTGGQSASQTGGQSGGQTGGMNQSGGGQGGGTQTPQGGEDRSFQSGQGDQGSGERIDTDNDGRTREPNDTRPTDDGGRGAPVQR
jgi:hypothetical protein